MAKKKKAIRGILHYLEYLSLSVFGAVVTVLPLRISYGFAGLLGWITFHVLGIRKQVTLENLRHAFGEEFSEQELLHIASQAYGNFAMTFMETLFLPRLLKRLDRVIDMSGAEILMNAHKKGRGVILVSCHFGSWEVNGAGIASLGIPVSAVAKRQVNPYVDDFITMRRTQAGMKVVLKGAPIKEIIRALHRGELVGLISDQDAGKDGVFVDFFGRKASTPRGAAELALKYAAPIIIVMTARTKPGFYRSIFREIDITAGDTVETVTQQYTTIMEEIIRDHPEQYFWMHKRWKSQPKA